MFIIAVYRTEKNGRWNDEYGEKVHSVASVLCVQHSASFYGKYLYA